MADNRSIDAINRTAAMNEENYVPTDLGITRTDESTRTLVSSTFGYIKHSVEAMWYSIGTSPNVNKAYEQALTDPSQSFEVQGKSFHTHPAVGKLQAYNEMGNPSGGVFTMHSIC